MIRRYETYYCDRCKKELKESPMFYIEKIIPKIAIQILRNEWHYADLCDDCKKSFRKWWKNADEEGKEE